MKLYYYPYYYPNPYQFYGSHYVQPTFPQNTYMPNQTFSNHAFHHIEENRQLITDHGKLPFTINIDRATERNNNFRTALWTGEYLQVTLMSIPVGEDIGLEVHPTTDQFIRIEEGEGIVRMGDNEQHLEFNVRVSEDDAIMIPAGKWHNLINTGGEPLKLYSIYAPPEHPFGTIHRTKADDAGH